MFGNADNIGYRIGVSFYKLGHEVKLIRTDEFGRGNPELYVKSSLPMDKLDLSGFNLRKVFFYGHDVFTDLNKNYDIAIISGWNALIVSRHLKIPKFFIPVGYEIHTHARLNRFFPNPAKLLLNFSEIKRNYFYSYLTRYSLKKIDYICDWFTFTLKVYKSLGLTSRVVPIPIPENCELTRSLINAELKNAIEEESMKYKRVFLWFSRLHFLNPDNASYKGIELFMEALEKLNMEIPNNNFLVYMGKHGFEVKEFEERFSKYGIYKKIKWLDHLEYPDLVTYLSLDNAVLFTDFGKVNSGIGGICRDGYCVGVPMINSTLEETMVSQYGSPGPRIYADSEDSIYDAMKKMLVISDKEFATIKNNTLEFGETYIGFLSFYSKIMGLYENKVSH